MRAKGTPEELAARREWASGLLARGLTITALAKTIGLSRQRF